MNLSFFLSFSTVYYYYLLYPLFGLINLVLDYLVNIYSVFYRISYLSFLLNLIFFYNSKLIYDSNYIFFWFYFSIDCLKLLSYFFIFIPSFFFWFTVDLVSRLFSFMNIGEAMNSIYFSTLGLISFLIFYMNPLFLLPCILLTIIS